MLKQLAPKDSMPPSPKSRACTSRATDTEMQAEYGPIKMAIRVPPTACPVVPPNRGTLNIIIKKDSAANMPSWGIFALLISFLTFFTETAQTGTIAAAITAQVDGLR
jgi:hypothetical protein